MAGKKRKAAVKQEDSKKQQKQDGQKAISHDIDVPIDEGFQQDGKHLMQVNLSPKSPSLKLILGGAKVFIDDDGIIYDASLNQTNIGGNNNKVCCALQLIWIATNSNQFYRLQLLVNEKDGAYYCHTRWGRVGE